MKYPGGGGDISFFYLTYYCSKFFGARLENPEINKRGGPNNSGAGEDLRVCFIEILGLYLRKVGKPLQKILKKR